MLGSLDRQEPEVKEQTSDCWELMVQLVEWLLRNKLKSSLNFLFAESEVF